MPYSLSQKDLFYEDLDDDSHEHYHSAGKGITNDAYANVVSGIL